MSVQFKSIEIEAFRVYKEKQVYDFTLSSGKIAQLVVIYAPNGFGKTSLYDAVEWGLTKKINRITQNAIIGNTANREKGYILKNKESNNPFGRVKFIDHNDDIFEIKTKQLDGRRKTDYCDGDIINKTSSILSSLYGSNISETNFLSHDKIDAFLLFSAPHERYKTLSHFWDYSNDTHLYKSLLILYKEAENYEGVIIDKIKFLDQEITKLSTPIIEVDSYISQFNTLPKINFKINELGKVTSSDEIEKYVESYLENRATINEKLRTLNYKLESLDYLERSYSELLQKKTNCQVIEKGYQETWTILEKFHKLPIYEGLLNDYTNQINLLNKDIKNYELLLNNEDDYIKTSTELEQILKNNVFIENQIIETRKTNEKSNLVLLQSTKELEKNKKNLQELFLHKGNISENCNKYFFYTNKLEKCNKKLTNLKKVTKLRRDKLCTLDTQEIQLDNLLLLDNIQLMQNEYVNQKYSKEISECKTQQLLLTNLDIELKASEKQYLEYGNLNEKLNDIIKNGKGLVERTKTTVCPLCSYRYDSFEQLLKNIDLEIPDILGLNKLSQNVAEFKLKIDALQEKVKNNIISIKDKIRKDILSYRDKGSYLKIKIGRTELKSHNILNELNFWTDKYKSVEPFFTKIGIDILNAEEVYNANKSAQNLIDRISSDIRNYETTIRNLVNEIASNEQKINGFKSASNLNKLRLSQLNSNQSYTIFKNKLSEIELNYLPKTIKEKYNGFCQLKHEITNKHSELGKLIQRIKNEIALYKYEDLNQRLTDLKQNKLEIEKWLDEYNKKASEILLKSGSEISLEIFQSTKKDVNDLIEVTNKALELINKIIEHVDFVRKNAERIEKEKEQKIKHMELESATNFKNKIGNYKQKAQDVILEKINKAFNLDAINEIYSRIEPHPNIKFVEFTPLFIDDRPELEVYGKANDRESIQPILYLSSAQIDILSLSIFLAQALQPNKFRLNTIFMDDPVNHMDSINVLSFIDLLRTITMNLGRQIIISTHNENLFNLIKKKIDPKYYSSKFIELCSYGKIKE